MALGKHSEIFHQNLCIDHHQQYEIFSLLLSCFWDHQAKTDRKITVLKAKMIYYECYTCVSFE